MVDIVDIFAIDKLGLTGIWHDVPKPDLKELPAHYGLTKKELKEMRNRDIDAFARKLQYERTAGRASDSGWNKHRYGKGKSR